jgi:hypothetical protein
MTVGRGQGGENDEDDREYVDKSGDDNCEYEEESSGLVQGIKCEGYHQNHFLSNYTFSVPVETPHLH